MLLEIENIIWLGSGFCKGFDLKRYPDVKVHHFDFLSMHSHYPDYINNKCVHKFIYYKEPSDTFLVLNNITRSCAENYFNPNLHPNLKVVDRKAINNSIYLPDLLTSFASEFNFLICDIPELTFEFDEKLVDVLVNQKYKFIKLNVGFSGGLDKSLVKDIRTVFNSAGYVEIPGEIACGYHYICFLLNLEYKFLESDFIQLKNDNSKLFTSLEDAEAERIGLSSEISKLSNDNSALINEVNVKVNENSELRSNLEDTKKECVSLSTKNDKLANENSALLKNIEDLNSNNTELSIKLAELTNTSKSENLVFTKIIKLLISSIDNELAKFENDVRSHEHFAGLAKLVSNQANKKVKLPLSSIADVDKFVKDIIDPLHSFNYNLLNFFQEKTTSLHSKIDSLTFEQKHFENSIQEQIHDFAENFNSVTSELSKQLNTSDAEILEFPIDISRNASSDTSNGTLEYVRENADLGEYFAHLLSSIRNITSFCIELADNEEKTSHSLSKLKTSMASLEKQYKDLSLAHEKTKLNYLNVNHLFVSEIIQSVEDKIKDKSIYKGYPSEVENSLNTIKRMLSDLSVDNFQEQLGTYGQEFINFFNLIFNVLKELKDDRARKVTFLNNRKEQIEKLNLRIDDLSDEASYFKDLSSKYQSKVEEMQSLMNGMDEDKEGYFVKKIEEYRSLYRFSEERLCEYKSIIDHLSELNQSLASLSEQK